MLRAYHHAGKAIIVLDHPTSSPRRTAHVCRKFLEGNIKKYGSISPHKTVLPWGKVYICSRRRCCLIVVCHSPELQASRCSSACTCLMRSLELRQPTELVRRVRYIHTNDFHSILRCFLWITQCVRSMQLKRSAKRKMSDAKR